MPCKYNKIDFELSIETKDNYRFFAENEKKLYGVINSDGKKEVDFIYEIGGIKSFYKVGDKKINDKAKWSSDKKYDSGLKLKNTKTGEYDYYLQH